MIYEVAAAVEHIVSLLPKTVGAEALAGFSSTLKDELETRCQTCWRPSEPEYGSAKRAVHWQLHPAGEGADTAILCAATSVLAAHPQEHHSDVGVLTCRARQRQQAVALALQWLPHPFTLWIDPGTVSVRVGAGPGANSALQEITTTLGPAPTWAAVSVVWSAHAKPVMQHRPSISSIRFPTAGNVSNSGNPSRPIAIVRPTASTQQQQRPSMYQHHQRSVSSCSTVSSSTSASVAPCPPSLTRSISLSSNASTASTEATSISSGSFMRTNVKRDQEDYDVDVDSDATPYCPQLSSPFGSSVTSSPAADDDDDNGNDTTVGNVTATPFPGAVHLLDVMTRKNVEEEEDDDDAGDVTLGADAVSADRTLLLADLQPSAVIDSSTPKRVVAVPVPAKSNYTTHDNGNVGVLGGGVRLGGGIPAKPNTTTANNATMQQRYRQHSYSHSLTYVQPFYPPVPPNHPYQHHQQQQQYRLPQPQFCPPMMKSEHYVARALPMGPPTSMRAPTMQLHQHRSVPHLAMAYNGHQAFAIGKGVHQHQQQYFVGDMRTGGSNGGGRAAVSFALPKLPANGEVSAEEGSEAARQQRRVRSRGRRSRGRGAGRAARRQAAALRGNATAIDDDEPNDDNDIADDDGAESSDAHLTDAESNFSSRCSTPANPTTTSTYPIPSPARLTTHYNTPAYPHQQHYPFATPMAM